MAHLAQGEVVAIDGKTVRRSHDRWRNRKAIHLVSAWASANNMTLGQVKTEEKSNEITAIPQLLELLALRGCIVTIDAMGCQRDIAEQIVAAEADYVLAVKENQRQLYDNVKDLFQGAEEWDFEGVPHDYARTLNKGHGRIENIPRMEQLSQLNSDEQECKQILGRDSEGESRNGEVPCSGKQSQWTPQHY